MKIHLANFGFFSDTLTADRLCSLTIETIPVLFLDRIFVTDRRPLVLLKVCVLLLKYFGLEGEDVSRSRRDAILIKNLLVKAWLGAALWTTSTVE